MTFCIVINQALNTQFCPLPKGSCVWKHRLTGQCRYDPEFAKSDFTIQELAARVGAPCPTAEEAEALRAKLLENLKENLSSK